MNTNEDTLLKVSEFIAEYSALLMGSGVHTSRVVRNSKRIGEAFGIDVNISVFQKNIILSAKNKEGNETYSAVADITPRHISFELNSELSTLSWEVHDRRLSYDEMKAQYDKIVASPTIHPLFVLIMAGFANASFCRIFGGDFFSMGIVFSSTLIGLFAKQRMQAHHVNNYITFTVSAFIASVCASLALIFDITSEIALSTSVLYLIPGVPLINGVIDIVEGYILTGFARLTEAFLLVLCIATGLAATLILVKDSLI